jgi:hypothetical protein
VRHHKYLSGPNREYYQAPARLGGALLRLRDAIGRLALDPDGYVEAPTGYRGEVFQDYTWDTTVKECRGLRWVLSCTIPRVDCDIPAAGTGSSTTSCRRRST